MTITELVLLILNFTSCIVCLCLCFFNIEIERVTQFNFLGVIISSNMKWNGHVTHISQKISRIVGIMYRLKHIYP